MADLQASAVYKKVASDKDFQAFAPEKKIQYLREVVLPRTDKTFSGLSPDLQEQYINEVVMPKLTPPKPLSTGPALTQPAPTNQGMAAGSDIGQVKPAMAPNELLDGYESPALTRHFQATAKKTRSDIAASHGSWGETQLSRPRFDLGQQIQHVSQAIPAGVLKGVMPVHEIDTPWGSYENVTGYKFDPAGDFAENAARFPTALAANIILGSATGGAYEVSGGR